VSTDPRTQPVKQPPGFENAGKPGYYTVKPGDTLIRIGLESRQSHKDISRWNALENPNKIEVGQVLRIVPPVANGTVSAKPVVAATSHYHRIASGQPIPLPQQALLPALRPRRRLPPASAPLQTPCPSRPAGGDDTVAWIVARQRCRIDRLR